MSKILNIQLSTLFFLQFFVWGSWYVTLGTYLLETLDFSGREVGLIYGATAIAAAISPFFLGLLADRFFNLERLMSILHFLGGIVMICVSYSTAFFWFYTILIAYALLYIPTFSLSNALAFHHLKDATRDFPRVRVWGTVGWVLAGLLVSGLKWEDTAHPMQLAAGASFVLGLFSVFLPSTPPQARKGKPGLKDIFGPEVLALFRKRSFAVLVICLVLISIPSGFYYSFVNPFLNELGMNNAAGKMSLGQVSEVGVMLLMPFFFSRLSFKAIIAFGLLAWGVRYILFAFGNMEASIWMLYVGILLHGFAFNFAILAAQIYIDRIVPSNVRSMAQGFMAQVTLGIGALIGAFAAGETVSHYTGGNGSHDWNNIWLVPGVFGLLVTIGFVVFFSGQHHMKISRKDNEAPTSD